MHGHTPTHAPATYKDSVQAHRVHAHNAQAYILATHSIRLQVEKRLRVELGRLFWTVDFALEDEMAQAGTGPERAEGARQRSSLTPAV